MSQVNRPGVLGKTANLRLGQAALPEGRANGQLPQRPHSRPVARVVRGVGTVQQHREAVVFRRPEDLPEQRIFAVIAAVRGVLHNRAAHKNVHIQHLHIRAHLVRQPPGVFQFKFRLEGGAHVIGFDPGGVPLRRVQQVRRIHAAGKGNGSLPILGKNCSNVILLPPVLRKSFFPLYTRM